MAYERDCELVEVELGVEAITEGATRDAFEAARAAAFALGLTIMFAVVCKGRAELEGRCWSHNQAVLACEDASNEVYDRIVV